MKDDKYIQAQINKPFVVTLQSNVGSTNYSWGLTKMPESVFLLFTENVPVNQGGPNVGNLVEQRFIFAFNGQINTNMATIEFSLLNLSLPSCKGGAKTIEVNVKVVSSTEEKDENLSEFVKIDGQTATYKEMDAVPILKYNYLSEDCCNVKYNYPDACSTAVRPYGFPNETCSVFYNYPPARAYGYSSVNDCCVQKYNFPPIPPIMDYNYCDTNDCCIEKCNYPPVFKYNYPCK